ncbi:MAG: hypothetical protein ACJA0F_001797 [Dinoroseobacter sp.]|jgi:hypothetical protein
MTQESREIHYCPNMRLLMSIAHPSKAHIFDYPLAQRAHLLLGHGNLLIDD